MKLAATIATLVGIVISGAAIQSNQLLWLAGSLPLIVLGVYLFLQKEVKQ